MYAVSDCEVVIASQSLRHGYLSASANEAYGGVGERATHVPSGSFFRADPSAGASEEVWAYVNGSFTIAIRREFWESLTPSQREFLDVPPSILPFILYDDENFTPQFEIA